METHTSNLFVSLVKALWARGEDGEVIAYELVAALDYVCTEGVGRDKVDKEIKRLLTEVRKDPVKL